MSCIPERYKTSEIVSEAFKAHFAYIKTHYREVVVMPSKDLIQAKQKLNLKLQKSLCGSRKSMYVQCIFILLFIL